MPELPLIAWGLIIAALVAGILAGHYGWGRGWPRSRGTLHADYLTGLDYLVSEQPDRALDTFLKLMDADAETLETHFALGTLYRRRGEVERAIRIHRNLLARPALAAEHREQALLALAQDYLRAGLLDRAEGLFQQVSAVPRLRVTALDALRGVYERQRDWAQALGAWRQMAAAGAAAPRIVAAHYCCELAAEALERSDREAVRAALRQARAEAGPFPRAAVIRAELAQREGDVALASRLLDWAIREAPLLLQEQLPRLLRLTGPAGRDAVLEALVARAAGRGFDDLKRLVFAALAADLAQAAPLRASIERVFAEDPTLAALSRAGGRRAPDQVAPDRATFERIALEIGTLLSHAENYRCNECGFTGRKFYWQCPGCHSWDSFEPYAIVKLR
jgi:lipopolysaccharide biosynthesis regulator YciM